jgi:hypothetical protein
LILFQKKPGSKTLLISRIINWHQSGTPGAGKVEIVDRNGKVKSNRWR